MRRAEDWLGFLMFWRFHLFEPFEHHRSPQAYQMVNFSSAPTAQWMAFEAMSNRQLAILPNYDTQVTLILLTMLDATSRNLSPRPLTT